MRHDILIETSKLTQKLTNKDQKLRPDRHFTSIEEEIKRVTIDHFCTVEY